MTDKINPHKIRARKIVKGLIEQKPYDEIGKEVYPNTAYPRQTVYRSIQSPVVQAELQKQLTRKVDIKTQLSNWKDRFDESFSLPCS